MSPVFIRPENGLMQLVLYKHPRDYPQHYVIRAWAIIPGEPEPLPSRAAVLFLTETAAREWVMQEHSDLVELGRQPDDEAQIVTLWT
jgi:hypothetical protein